MKPVSAAVVAFVVPFVAAVAAADESGPSAIYEGKALVDLLSTHKLTWTPADRPAAEMWLPSAGTVRFESGRITSRGPTSVDARNALCGVDFVLPLRTWACVKLVRQPSGGFDLVFFDAAGRPSRSEHARVVELAGAGQ